MTNKPHIKFGMVRTDEELDSLTKFAESFDHKVGRDSILPIYTIGRGEQMLGYFNVLCRPIVYPCMHPRLTTPRDFQEVILALKHHFCLNSIDNRFPNGIGLMALPTVPIVPNSVFERYGFTNTHKEIWQAIP